MKGQRMRPGRRELARVAVVALLAGSLAAVLPGSAHADELTQRKCATILTGDKVRRLDVCVRGWRNTGWTTTRGVVEMHTYALLGGINDWVDSRSQSITLEVAENDCCGRAQWPDGGWQFKVSWGQSVSGGGNCRINGPGGSVGCSVPNTVRVAFYGPAITTPSQIETYVTHTTYVSWRDDRGEPHRLVLVYDPVRRRPPLVSPLWNA
jgi:hypothetical protein